MRRDSSQDGKEPHSILKRRHVLSTEALAQGHSNASSDGRQRAAAILTALGIVYGDIGTSPLYVFRAISKALGGKLDEPSALGSLSLIFWAILIVVTIKYCLFVMRADNRGEGGILALMSLSRATWRGRNRYLLVFGLIGAALIYGDGVITPAISVLSAVEGLDVASHQFATFAMPIAAAILILLFAFQRFGTAIVGKAFGPVMVVWFTAIALLGVMSIIRQPHVLVAINPAYGVAFLLNHGFASFSILGAVYLSVTGAEAMYADMGHVGRSSIRIAWFALVMPALLLNYAGQTAIVIGPAQHASNPFYQLAPHWALYPLVALATLATVIASQAIISGAFSMTRQAMQLGWLPGMKIFQTSSEKAGQIYIPFVNWLMMAVTLALTVSFASSEKLAGAYGTAVSTTMIMTTALLYRVMRVSWRWKPGYSLLVFCLLMFFDVVFFAANLTKISDGGWIPILVGIAIFVVMMTWHSGLDAMHRRQHQDTVTIKHFVRQLHDKHIKRVPGKAIFLTRLDGTIPPLIANHVRQMGSFYEDVAALTVRFAGRPRIEHERRIKAKRLGEGFWHVTIRFGFVEIPNVPRVLRDAKEQCPFPLDDALYFSEHDRVVRRKTSPRFAAWRRHLFSFLHRNSIYPSDRFYFPSKSFVQIVRQREI
jgi:KUP system potassium uptake protein